MTPDSTAVGKPEADSRALFRPGLHNHSGHLVEPQSGIEEFHPAQFAEHHRLRSDTGHLPIEILPGKQLDLNPFGHLLFENLP